MHDHKFDPARAERLLSPERYHELNPDILLQRLAVPPGHTILDLGCGNGFFTFPAAAAMGDDGEVIAADSSLQMLELLRRRNPPDTVQILETGETRIELEDECVDAVVGICLFHEFDDPAQNLAELHRILIPDGRLMFLDWDPDGLQQKGPEHSHRVARAEAETALKGCHFQVDVAEAYTPDHWLIIAHRD